MTIRLKNSMLWIHTIRDMGASIMPQYHKSVNVLYSLERRIFHRPKTHRLAKDTNKPKEF